MKYIIRLILDLFVDTTEEYWIWTWESEEERQAFIKYFKFCN